MLRWRWCYINTYYTIILIETIRTLSISSASVPRPGPSSTTFSWLGDPMWSHSLTHQIRDQLQTNHKMVTFVSIMGNTVQIQERWTIIASASGSSNQVTTGSTESLTCGSVNHIVNAIRWITHEWFLNQFRKVPESLVNGSWITHEWFLNHFWVVSESLPSGSWILMLTLGSWNTREWVEDFYINLLGTPMVKC